TRVISTHACMSITATGSAEGASADRDERAAGEARLASALLASAHLTYADYSAGACLSSTDVRGIEFMDDAATLPSGYWVGLRSETLNLSGTRVRTYVRAALDSWRSPMARVGCAPGPDGRGRTRRYGVSQLALAHRG